MNELYWITRLDSMYIVNNVLFVMCVIVVLVTLGFRGLYFLNADGIQDEYSQDAMKKCKKVSRISEVLLVVFMVIKMLLPTTEEALIITGVGTIVDYSKTNEQLQELPDKAVKALDMYFDEMLKETE